MNSTLRVPSKHDEAEAKGVFSSAWLWVPRHWLVFWMFALCGMLLVLLLLAIPSHAQLSPGPLSKAHQDMDGPTGCVRCHAVSPGSPTFRCLECHQEIAARLQQKRGLHPVFMAEPKASCVRCHSEHNGSQFVLVRWDPSPAKFDHSKAGFPLDGKHAGLACNKCHNAKDISSVERATIKMKDVNRSYLGLSKNCASCHEDKHKGQLGSNCGQCHNSTNWKDTRTFDHSKTKYALTGVHMQVKCAQCHVSGDNGVPKYVGLKFDRCAACHTDVHKGEFKQTCESCHSTASWKRTNFVTEFDHSKTKYPLQGKHQEVSCLACHRNGDFKAEIAYRDCRDCHKPDPHGGQFLARADGGRCEPCHTVTGFKPAKYTVADHKSTKFALQEKHVDVECAKCHIPAGKATIFVIKVTTCIGCHKDVHHGQFSGAPNYDRCEQCHNQTTFHAAGFDLARHQKTRFVLTGGHIAVACNDCHKPTTADGKDPVFHFEGLSCTTCHNDPHKRQFAARMQLVDSSGKAPGCEACHSTKSWSELARFNHDDTKFKLTGTHKAVECAGCHRPPNMERKLTNVDYHAAPTQCEDCHQNVHGPQFIKTSSVTASVTHCADCHTTNKWRPSLIDHEKTTFSLRGAHQNVRCGACHKETEQIDGKSVVVYKQAPSKCAACHGNSLGNRAT